VPGVLRSTSLLAFVSRRTLSAFGLLLGVTVVGFLLVQVAPGNIAYANLGDQGVNDPKVVQAFRERAGLDKPLPVQYWRYLERLAQGDLGESLASREQVSTNLGRYIPATLEIAVPAIIIAILVSVALGTVAALRRGRAADQGIRVLSLFGVSTPPFWLALIAVFVITYKLHWLPGGSRLGPQYDAPPDVTGLYTIDATLAGQWAKLGDALKHLIMPVGILAAYVIGLLTRFTRSAVLEVLGKEYVLNAWAKGLPSRVVLLRYILRPALIPVITVSGLAFGTLLSGAVLVERVFSWPGLGQYAYRSASGLDLPAIIGVTLFVAIVYIGVNLVVDVLYTVIDPRIRVR
jgi:peptide/nickel transport system permease protein